MNPIESLLTLAFGLMRALIQGILAAFGLAARRAVAIIEVRRGTAEQVLDLRHRVLRPGRPAETAIFDGDHAPATRHWVAIQADRVVGVASVMQAPHPTRPDGPRWQLRGMAVEPDLQGSGVGRAVLEAVQAEVTDDLWCNARVAVVPFYERSGWRAEGDVFDVAGVGPHRRMTWTAG